MWTTMQQWPLWMVIKSRWIFMYKIKNFILEIYIRNTFMCYFFSASIPANILNFPVLSGSNYQIPPQILELLFHDIFSQSKWSKQRLWSLSYSGIFYFFIRLSVYMFSWVPLKVLYWPKCRRLIERVISC